MYEHSLRKPSGHATYTDDTTGKIIQEYDTLQCVHCQYTWQAVQGSGTIRGWCFKCKGVICGQRECLIECVPSEARLEIWEGNKKTINKYLSTVFVQKQLEFERQAKSFIEKLMKKYANLPIF